MMLPRAKFIKILIIVIIVALLGFLAWKYFKPKDQAPNYITADVTREDIQNTVLATGTLDATKIISVGAQVSGQVQKMYVELGQEVKKGDLIAQIDSTTQQNSLKTSDANIANLQAQRLQQVANLNHMQQEYQRQKQMYAQDATSRSSYESALASYQTAQAQIKAVDAQIQSARVTRNTAETNIGYTRISAPINGTIVAIVTEEGQTVNANQSAPTIVKLANLQNMTIKAEISEADVMKVKKGQTVYFTTLGDSNTKHYATLRQVEPAPSSIATESNSNSSSSTSNSAVYYNALFDVPNPEGKLRIDMTANVTIILQDAKNTLSIPSTALRTENANKRNKPNSQPSPAAHASSSKDAQAAQPRMKPSRLQLTASEQQQVDAGTASLAMVRVLNADGTTRLQQVLVGINNRVNAEILKGLTQGEQVIVADGSDNSNDSAKRSNRRGPMGM